MRASVNALLAILAQTLLDTRPETKIASGKTMKFCHKPDRAAGVGLHSSQIA